MAFKTTLADQLETIAKLNLINIANRKKNNEKYIPTIQFSNGMEIKNVEITDAEKDAALFISDIRNIKNNPAHKFNNPNFGK